MTGSESSRSDAKQNPNKRLSEQQQRTSFDQETPLPNLAQQARIDARLLTPSGILQLQRTIGNQATRRMLSIAPPATHLVQRRIGLRDENAMAQYIEAVDHITKQNAGQRINYDSVVRNMMSAVETQLSALHISPLPQTILGKLPAGTMGRFDKPTWTIIVKTEKNGIFNKDQLQELSNTLYHEARHCEQAWLATKYYANKNTGLDAASLASAMNIPQPVAEAVLKDSTRMNEEQQELGETFYRTRLAEDEDYVDLVSGLKRELSTLSNAIPGLKSRLWPRKKFTQWKVKRQLRTWYPKFTDAAANKEEALKNKDQDALKRDQKTMRFHLPGIYKKLEIFRGFLNKNTIDANTLEKPITDFQTKIHNAYEGYAIEQDTFDLEKELNDWRRGTYPKDTEAFKKTQIEGDKNEFATVMIGGAQKEAPETTTEEMVTEDEVTESMTTESESE